MATDAELSRLLHGDPTAAAQQLAQAEGLTLLSSKNTSGYKGVSAVTSKLGVCNTFLARVRVNGSDLHLGVFESAAEAALAYARYLGPVRCAEEAQKIPKAPKHKPFGVPLIERQREQPPGGADEVTTVESVLADSRDHGGEEDGDANTPVSVDASRLPKHDAALMVEVEPVDNSCIRRTPSSSNNMTMCSTSGGASFKRKRIAHTVTDEYEMPRTIRELTVPVPEGAVRAAITFHFA